MTSKALIILMVAVIVGGGSLAFTQEKPKTQTETNPISGQAIYRSSCAACHGIDGKGNGPAASALKKAPPDLTQISKKNGGKFPTMVVSNIIRGDQVIDVHGSREMPMWGDVFHGTNRDETVIELKIHNLSNYLESIQQK